MVERCNMNITVVFGKQMRYSKSFKWHLRRKTKSFLYEIRTEFIIKGMNDEVETISSETLDVCTWEDDNGKDYLDFFIRCRLEDYWMSHGEIRRFAEEAYDFVKGHANGCRDVPVVVDLKVCTVLQENESLKATRKRSISADNLVPLRLSAATIRCEKVEDLSTRQQLAIISPKIRARSVDEGLALMQVCPICERTPSVGALISVLHGCRHAFHSHCLVGVLMETMQCPLCHTQCALPGRE